MSGSYSVTWRRQWHPTPALLPGKSHGWRSLVGCSPWGREESDTTERLHFDFSLPCIGEGNGSPLQCSCLENPRDGGAWWAAVCGVAQSWTRLKRLSSSSSSRELKAECLLECRMLAPILYRNNQENITTTQSFFLFFTTQSFCWTCVSIRDARHSCTHPKNTWHCSPSQRRTEDG